MKLKYFDADEEIFKEEMITPDLYNDLKFFQRYKSMKMKDKGVCTRATRKGLEIKGEFIINQTPKSIYVHEKTLWRKITMVYIHTKDDNSFINAQ